MNIFKIIKNDDLNLRVAEGTLRARKKYMGARVRRRAKGLAILKCCKLFNDYDYDYRINDCSIRYYNRDM
jgi:hypothetical protein